MKRPPKLLQFSPLIFLIFFYLSSLVTHAAIRTVNSTLDNNTAGTFRYEVTNAANGDEIRFNLPGGTTSQLITLSTPITINKNNLLINGASEPDYNCDKPIVVIDIGWPGTFTLQGTGNTVRGISFRNVLFVFDGGGTHTVQGCWFNLNDNGTGVSGTNVANNLMRFINSSTGNTIGGVGCGLRNVFSEGGTFTDQGFVRVNSGCNNNTFRGNYFGTDKTGMNLLNQNSDDIFNIISSQNITIDQNVISGANSSGFEGGTGIYVNTGTVSGLTITGNKIGVRQDGSSGGSTWGNAYGGVFIDATTCNNFTFDDNIVCYNGLVSFPDFRKSGVYFKATATTVNVRRNYIGVIPTTYAKAGNYFAGFYVAGSCNTMLFENNVIGDNGSTHAPPALTDGDESHGLAIEAACSNVTIINNYIGYSPAGGDVGNWCSGITISQGSNFTIRNNYIGFNKGWRDDISNAGVLINGTTDVVIQGNTIGGMTALGLFAGQRTFPMMTEGGNGILIFGNARRIRIGGMNAGEPNIIAYNGNNGIKVMSSDYIEMRYNSLYCNVNKGINLHYNTASVGNNGFGNGTLSITGPVPTTPVNLSGARPGNSVVDVFGTHSCAGSSVSCITQGEYRYTSTYAYPAATTWTYNNGSAMFDDISALATSTTECESGFCRTSEFSTCINNQLPVTFINFNTLSKGESVEVLWATSMEENAHSYVIERSDDGVGFTAIGEEKAAGNSSSVLTYSFTDRNPLSGVSFYRLRQVDRDGKYAFSPIVSVKRTGEFELSVHPNPTQGVFTITVNNPSSEVALTIHTMLGELIYSDAITSTVSYVEIPVQLNNLAKGVYVVNVRGEGSVRSLKVVID